MARRMAALMAARIAFAILSKEEGYVRQKTLEVSLSQNGYGLGALFKHKFKNKHIPVCEKLFLQDKSLFAQRAGHPWFCNVKSSVCDSKEPQDDH